MGFIRIRSYTHMFRIKTSGAKSTARTDTVLRSDSGNNILLGCW